MPHVSSGGGDDLGSTDEVKVYNDEGEEEKRSSENLSEDKLGLVTESEEVRSKQQDIALKQLSNIDFDDESVDALRSALEYVVSCVYCLVYCRVRRQMVQEKTMRREMAKGLVQLTVSTSVHIVNVTLA